MRFLAFLFFINFGLFAQSINIPLNSQLYNYIDEWDVCYDGDSTGLHTSFKTLNAEKISNFILNQAIDSNRIIKQRSLFFKQNYPEEYEHQITSRKPILKKLYKYPTDFYRLVKKDFWFAINPIINFTYYYEKNKTESLFLNTRGLEIKGNIADKLSFYTQVTENQARFPSFITESSVNYKYPSVIGAGYFRKFKSSTGVDYFTATSYINFRAIKQIELEFGHGKHFIGNGLRSLILSDESANALYLKIQTTFWKFQYTNLFQQLTQRYPALIDGYREPKFMALHHLSYNITPNLNFGIFESVIFARDGGFDLQYLNPLIFYRAIEREIGSPDNVLVGMDAKWNFANMFSLYSQFVLDEFHFEGIKNLNGDFRNKFGFQLGAKYFDNIFSLPFNITAEYNMVRPFLYSHNTQAGAYLHYNRSLAHPHGANFHEMIGQINIQPHSDINVQLNAMYLLKGLDRATSDSTSINFGGDIFRNYSDKDGIDGFKIAGGVKQQIINLQGLITYMPIPNLFVDVSLQLRKEKINELNLNQNTWITSLAIRWNIANRNFIY